MLTETLLSVRRGSSHASDERRAVAEIRQRIHRADERVVLFFCSPTYDLPKLAAELRAAFDAPCIGCTTAGELGPEGFSSKGISAVSLSGDLSVRCHGIDLATCESDAVRIAESVGEELRPDAQAKAFGFLLVDGLSLMEERLTSALYQALPQVPLVGGSAGDDLSFRKTHVFVDGEFRSNAAVFAVFRTRIHFTTFKFEHFVPAGRPFVVTRSEPETRIIREIDGEPAAAAYARRVGVAKKDLDSKVFSANPLLLELGGELYIRSIFRANADGGLTLLCAIEDGVVLTLGRTIDPIQAATDAFQRVRDRIGKPSVVFGCDCILRRLEFENSGLLEPMGSILAENNVVGFSTFGEQYNGVHVNQTFTGVALGS